MFSLDPERDDEIKLEEMIIDQEVISDHLDLLHEHFGKEDNDDRDNRRNSRPDGR